MSLDALLDRLRGAGVADNDEVPSASTVRRLACEADIIPMVLGAPSDVLDVAHHVIPWTHDGPTDLSNGALLCGRHHTIVHQLELTASVTPREVIWHRPRPHRRP